MTHLRQTLIEKLRKVKKHWFWVLLFCLAVLIFDRFIWMTTIGCLLVGWFLSLCFSFCIRNNSLHYMRSYTEGNLNEISKRLKDFLTSEKSENIVLSGKWGTGKTEVWKRAVEKQQKKTVIWSWVALCFLFELFISIFHRFSWWNVLWCLIVSAFFFFFLYMRNRHFSRSQYAYVAVSGCKDLAALEEKILGAIQPCWQAGKNISIGSLIDREIVKPFFLTVSVLAILVVVSFGVWPLYQNLPIPFSLTPEWLSQYSFVLTSSSVSAIPHAETFFTKYSVFITPCLTICIAIFTALYVFFRSNRKALVFRNAIICLDDIERASKDLEPQDILNFAADLRDNKNCKVAMILNPDQFYEDKEPSPTEQNSTQNSSKKGEEKQASPTKLTKQEIWQRALEKGSNAHLVLKLDATDAAELALGKAEETDKDPLVENLREQVIDLGINNVRIIQRIWSDAMRWDEKERVKIFSKDALRRLDSEFTYISGYFKEQCEAELSKEYLWDFIVYHTLKHGDAFYNPSKEERNSIALSKNFYQSSYENDQIFWDNIKEGLLNENKAQRVLKKYFDKTLEHWKEAERIDYTASKKGIISKPKELAEGGGNAAEIKQALLAVPCTEETIAQIFLDPELGYYYLHYLLCLAKMKHINETDWANKFREECKNYIKDPKCSWDFSDVACSGFDCVDETLKKFGLKLKENRELKAQDEKQRNEEKKSLEKCLRRIRDSNVGMKTFSEFQDNYEGWNKESLKAIIKQNPDKYNPKDFKEIIQSFWKARIMYPMNAFDSPERPEFLYIYLIDSNPYKPLGLKVYCKCGVVLYEVLNEQVKTGVWNDPELDALLKDSDKHWWKELIAFPIPEQSEESLPQE